jgi:F-type H+-transporting ATPase subunit gamma
MAKLKEVKLKISGVKKTKQITKAMNMVAASRLRGAQTHMEAFRPYAAKFAEVLGSLAENAGEEANPLLVPREDAKKTGIVLCTSDRGLCGGFNANLINKAEKFAKQKTAEGMDISFTCFGKKGRNWCRSSKKKIVAQHIGVVGSAFGFSVASKAGRELVSAFVDNLYDEVFVVFAEFVSMAKQIPVVKQLLPKSVEVQLYSALLETSTSEHAARMMAMDNATKACNDMLTNLTLAYNKARQATITAELMDIVGGAEALKG